VSDPKFISDMSILVNKVSVNRSVEASVPKTSGMSILVNKVSVNRCVKASVPKTSGKRIVRSNRLVKGVVKKPEWMLKKVCV
jgi:hypothetical protein